MYDLVVTSALAANAGVLLDKEHLYFQRQLRSSTEDLREEILVNRASRISVSKDIDPVQFGGLITALLSKDFEEDDDD